MKKIVSFLMVSAVAATMATSALANGKNMTGFYVGANIGHGNGTAQSSFRNLDTKAGLSGALGGLFLGYQKDFGSMVAGLEGAASLSNAKHSSKIASGLLTNTLTLKRKDFYTIGGRLGFKLCNWLVYGKASYENAKFSASLNNVSNSKRLSGFVPGIGFETMLSNNVMFGGEWTYSMYKKKSSFGEVKPRIGDFKLRLGYKF